MRVHALLLAVLLTLSASAAVPLPSSSDRWLALTAGEFRIFSNVSPRQTRQLATDLLRMRAALGKLTRLNLDSKLPTYVFVFRNGRTFAPYRDALIGRENVPAAGVFLAGRIANFMIMRADEEGGAGRVIYHELTHHFLRNTVGDPPLWLNEGLAEYYSTFTAKGGNVSVGLPLPQHVKWLRDNQLAPLEDHFAVDRQSREYSETPRQVAFYAQSWALVHYLLHGPRDRHDQLGQFIEQLRAGKSHEEALRTTFGTDYAALEEELRSSVRKRTFVPMTYALEELQVPAVGEATPAPRDELLYALGAMFFSNRGTEAEAEALLIELRRIHPKHAEVHALIAHLHRQRRDALAAEVSSERAVSLGSQYVFAYVEYGRALVACGEIARARQLFEHATRLDPNDAYAWAQLGATYVGAPGDVTPGIAALEKSLSLEEAWGDVTLNLIQLYARAGRREDARRLSEIAIRGTDPEVTRLSLEAIWRVQLRMAEEQYEAGQHAEAIETMRVILARTTEARVKAHLQKFIRTHDENVERERQMDALRAVIATSKAGKVAEALRLLDALLPTVSDDAMKKNLEKLRRELGSRSR
ncbi:MAG TPA: tetratricopeptide repeat protein [Thermoanaerobaculia bacterium]